HLSHPKLFFLGRTLTKPCIGTPARVVTAISVPAIVILTLLVIAFEDRYSVKVDLAGNLISNRAMGGGPFKILCRVDFSLVLFGAISIFARQLLTTEQYRPVRHCSWAGISQRLIGAKPTTIVIAV